MALHTRNSVSHGVVSSSVGGWDNTWCSDGQGGCLRNGDSSWLAHFLTDSKSDCSRFWAVGGEISDSNVGGDGGDVSVASQSGGSQSRQGSEGRELHCGE